LHQPFLTVPLQVTMQIWCFPISTAFHPKNGRLFIVGIGPLGGGWGAKSREDGVSVTVCINDGDTHNSPTEQLDGQIPRAGRELQNASKTAQALANTAVVLGAEMVVQALSPFSVTTRIDRMHCKPWGLEGGGEAAGNGIGIRRKGEWQHELAQCQNFQCPS